MSWQLRTLIVLLSSILFGFTAANYRENLALRHPCNPINKRLQPYIAWTEKLASSQYKVQRDACGQIGSGPACCTHEIMNSYAMSYGTALQRLVDAELSRLTRLLSASKEQVNVWSKEYLRELRRLTISSLETLFGTQEYRSNVHPSVSTLFSTLGDTRSSADDVSKSTVDLFNRLILSLYRQFMVKDKHVLIDDKLQKCLVNKAFEMNVLPAQRELLYILTSGSSLTQIFRTMLVYIDADIRRLESTANMTSNLCIHRYARETLCPLCVSTSSPSNSINSDDNEPLCEDDCQYATKTCFNQTNNAFVGFASLAKGYAAIIHDIEQAIVELKLVERLSKLHIYLYDMVVKATNSREIYTQLQTACPDPNGKAFSPILSLPPTMTERRELVLQWNESLHLSLQQLHSSIDHLHTRLTQQIIIDICSNSNYAVKSNRCTRIDQQTMGLIQWSLPSIPSVTRTTNDAELTRNQLDDLKKKMLPIQQMILSLRPKKKHSLLEYLPNFDQYDDQVNPTSDNEEIPSWAAVETYDHDNQGSLSERLYKEIDGQTTRRSYTTTRKDFVHKQANKGQPITYSRLLYLTVFILQQASLIRK